MVATLYYIPGLSSLAIHATLKASKIPYEIVKVDMETKITERGEDFTSINPTGAIPALKLDDGRVLTQSIALQHYLGVLSKDPSFYFEDPFDEARLLEALGKCSDLHNDVCNYVFMGGKIDGYNRRMGEFEATIPSNGWILGTSEPSQADFYAATVLNWPTFEKIDISTDYPKLAAYKARVFTSPAFAACLKDEGLA